MIVSRKNENRIWENLEGSCSKISDGYVTKSHRVNGFWHRLYARSFWKDWDINGKPFGIFKARLL